MKLGASTQLLQKLIGFASVFPDDDGIVEFLVSYLHDLGFTCNVVEGSTCRNIYAELGAENGAGKTLAFAGHFDVVPSGDLGLWSVDPFVGEIVGGKVIGRGAVDMKGAIAAFMAATKLYLAEHGVPKGKLCFLLTGDEEVNSVGIQDLISWMEANGKNIDDAIIGEPSADQVIGDVYRHGRRGSVNFTLVVHGMQGHVAYPEKARNPHDILIPLLYELLQLNLDSGNDDFPASNLEITSIDVGNAAQNVIPASATAKFNIRFNNECSLQELVDRMHKVCAEFSGDCELSYQCSALPFVSSNPRMASLVKQVAWDNFGVKAHGNTGGGTSDARFIKDMVSSFVEVGLLNHTAHHVDEYVSIEDLNKLEELYYQMLLKYFN